MPPIHPDPSKGGGGIPAADSSLSGDGAASRLEAPDVFKLWQRLPGRRPAITLALVVASLGLTLAGEAGGDPIYNARYAAPWGIGSKGSGFVVTAPDVVI